MTEQPKTVPCEICGNPTSSLFTKRCNNCWEVEHRLPTYLKSPKGLEFIRDHLPLVDDWVDGHPDAWDYGAILCKHNIEVVWCDTLVDGEGNKVPAGDSTGWGMSWKHGYMSIGQTTEIIARKAAAMFVCLWLRGFSASFADKLMDGFVVFLERQESTTLCFLAEIDNLIEPYFRLTREGFCTREIFNRYCEKKIIKALDVQADEEVIVTFAKRRKNPA